MTWVQIRHQIPGRTRLRCDVLRHDRDACERIADVLAGLPGVREVNVRPYSSSVLVVHATDITAADLAERVRALLDAERVIPAGEAPPRAKDVPELSKLARLAATAFREIDRDVRRMSNGSVDLGTLTTLLFLGAGAAQAMTDSELEMPPWFNLAWWGYRTFMTNETREIQAARE